MSSAKSDEGKLTEHEKSDDVKFSKETESAPELITILDDAI